MTISMLKAENLISSFGFFDTLALSKFFKELKFTDQQAEGMSEILKLSQENLVGKKEILEEAKNEAKQEIRQEIDASTKELATKGDVQAVKQDVQLVRRDMELAKKELELKIEQVRVEISNSKVDIIKWVIGLLTIQTGLLLTLAKVFLN
jgi:hypothetical protein